MKQLTIILTALLALLCTACDKWPNDHPLDGMWQLRSEKHGATLTPALDRQVYWSFRRGMLQFSDTRNMRRYAHYIHRGDSLLVYNMATASLHVTPEDNNEWISIDKLYDIDRWGVYPQQDPEHPERVRANYRISTLDGDNLLLINESDTLSFRKF